MSGAATSTADGKDQRDHESSDAWESERRAAEAAALQRLERAEARLAATDPGDSEAVHRAVKRVKRASAEWHAAGDLTTWRTYLGKHPAALRTIRLRITDGAGRGTD